MSCLIFVVISGSGDPVHWGGFERVVFSMVTVDGWPWTTGSSATRLHHHHLLHRPEQLDPGQCILSAGADRDTPLHGL